MRLARHEKLINIIEEKGFVTTEELCRLLNASQATVRRDINVLDCQDRIRKTYGGAMALAKATADDTPMLIRRSIQREEKIRIATAALDLISDGESLFLDSGTTTYEMAVKLNAFKNLTIITNDIHIAYEISRSGSNNLIVIGGVCKKNSASLIGIFAEQTANQIHVDIAFLSADAVDVKSGIMDYNLEEIPIKRKMIENSRKRIALCDHTKFDNKAFISISPLAALDQIITGQEINPEVFGELSRAGVNIRTV